MSNIQNARQVSDDLLRSFIMAEMDSALTDYWGSLSRTVTAALHAGRIGIPQALRLTVHIHANIDTAVDVQHKIDVAVRRCATSWFGGTAISDQRVGEAAQPTASILRWTSGQSALLSISVGSGITTGNLILLGSHGSIYHRIDPPLDVQPVARP